MRVRKFVLPVLVINRFFFPQSVAVEAIKHTNSALSCFCLIQRMRLWFSWLLSVHRCQFYLIDNHENTTCVWFGIHGNVHASLSNWRSNCSGYYGVKILASIFDVRNRYPHWTCNCKWLAPLVIAICARSSANLDNSSDFFLTFEKKLKLAG